MQSCGGQVIFPPGYLRRVYDIVRRSGGVCIADEVQTGFGRVGSKWWAFQLDDDQLVPDIVTIGKPMGNGHPISAVITTPAIAEAFRRGPDYFNTYGGNPVSCAIALAVLDDKLRENAVRVGEHLKRRLQEMQPRHPMMGDVRGAGMFLASTWCCAGEPDSPLGRPPRLCCGATASPMPAPVRRLRSEHIIMSLDGPHENILKFKPPMLAPQRAQLKHCECQSRCSNEMNLLPVKPVIGFKQAEQRLANSSPGCSARRSESRSTSGSRWRRTSPRRSSRPAGRRAAGAEAGLVPVALAVAHVLGVAPDLRSAGGAGVGQAAVKAAEAGGLLVVKDVATAGQSAAALGAGQGDGRRLLLRLVFG
uniref:Alanine--glyoxylate aminotransferase 2, mitochondrial n=1 Tax=Macrostomum lignano TaxID=282301 RepID=A0A1I8IZD9_9PLAT